MTAIPIDIKLLDALIQKKQRRMEDLKRIEIELQVLRQARYTLAGRSAPAPVPSGATDSVLDLLRESPGVHTSQQVAEMLQNKVFTKSDDPRRVIISTIANLARDGVVERDQLGRLSLSKSEVAMA